MKPGKGAAFVRTKMRNYLTGNTVEKTFRAGSTVMSTELEVQCSCIVLHVNHTICQQVNCICSIPTNLLSASTLCWQFTLGPNLIFIFYHLLVACFNLVDCKNMTLFNIQVIIGLTLLLENNFSI